MQQTIDNIDLKYTRDIVVLPSKSPS